MQKKFLEFMLLFFSLTATSLSAADETPIDLLANSDFQYVVKVLRIQDNQDAIERLALSWNNLNNFLTELKTSLQEFEAIRGSISHNLATVGREYCLAFPIAVGVGGIFECGIGYHNNRLRTTAHIRIGWRQLFSDMETRGSLVAAVMIMARNIFVKNPNARTLENAEAESKGAFIGFGGFRNEKSPNEVGIGIGAGAFSWESSTFGFAIPISPSVESTELKLLQSLEEILKYMAQDLHRLDLHMAGQKLDEFEIGVTELRERIKDRYISEPMPVEITVHPLANIQNLFEPSAVAASLQDACKKNLVMVGSGTPQKALGDGKSGD